MSNQNEHSHLIVTPVRLTAENFKAFALKHYNDPQSLDPSDLEEDLDTFKYIKKILARCVKNNQFDVESIRERLLVNHIILLTNVFGVLPTIRMLFFRVNPEHHAIIKTVLIYLKYITPHHAYYLYKYDQLNINEVEIIHPLMVQLHKNEFESEEQQDESD